MPRLGDNRLRARMMTLASQLFHDTQVEDLSNPSNAEQIAKDAVELAGLAKVFLVRAHDQRLAPYATEMTARMQDALTDNKNVTSHEQLMDQYVREACDRRNRA